MKSSYQKILILLLAAVALGWWTWQKFEWVDEKKWVGAKSHIENRPMYAAGKFLQALDYSVARIADQKRFDEIPASVGTIFICEAKALVSEDHFEEINRWLRQGGHLVLNSAGGGQLLEEEDAHGQQSYGIRSVPVAQLYQSAGISLGNAAASQDCWQQELDFEPLQETGEAALNEVVAAARSTPDGDHDQVFTPVRFSNTLPGASQDRATAVQFEASNWLQMAGASGADWQWSTERGVQLYSLLIGRGRLTVMADFSPFFNAGIGELDNAFALQSIVEQGANDGKDIWFHERDLDFPSLSSVLWKRAPQLMLSTLSLLLVSIWALFSRRQEPLSVSISAASQLRSQLYAVAAYRWRVGDMQGLHKPLEQSPHSVGPVGGEAAESAHQRAEKRRSKLLVLERAHAHWRISTNSRRES